MIVMHECTSFPFRILILYVHMHRKLSAQFMTPLYPDRHEMAFAQSYMLKLLFNVSLITMEVRCRQRYTKALGLVHHLFAVC